MLDSFVADMIKEEEMKISNIQKTRVTLLFFLLTLLLVPVNGNIGGKDDPVWLQNIASCPIRLQVSRHTRLLFSNIGVAPVSEVQVGLVQNDNGKLKVAKRGGFLRLNGPELKGKEGQFAGGSDFVNEIDSASETAKLAVIYVKFSDGSTWQLGSSCGSKS